MRALYRSGRQADALSAYQQARRVLGEELGLDPSPPAAAAGQAILRQDPSLAAAPAWRRARGTTSQPG
jgi:DNA-binding SARP family transcriptional activator